MCQKWTTDGLGPGGQATHQLEQVISQPLASSTTSPLRHFVPVSLRARLLSTPTSLPVCLSVILPFVATCPHLPAVCLAENRHPPLPLFIASERGHAQTIITQPTAPYLELRPHCAIGCPTIFRTKDHEKQSTLQRGARLPAHHNLRWLKAVAPMLVRLDRHLRASFG